MNQWDKFAREYDKIMGGAGDIPHQKLIDPAIQQFLGNVSEKVILDAGCGNGYWVRRLSNSAKKVIGIDSSKELIKIAKRRGSFSNVSFKIADLVKALPFEDGYFDIILSSMVLHYLPDINSVAKEFKRVLKKGGKIVFSICHPKCEAFKKKELKTVKRRTKYSIKAFGQRAVVKEYYESLKGYQKAFKEADFKFIGLKEPQITEEVIKEYPHYQKLKGLPRAAIFCWRKN